MSQSTSVLDTTYNAAADLSSKQYYIMKISAALNVNVATSRTDISLGILQNEPTANEAAVVRVLGTSKAKCNGTITINAQVTATADGRIYAADTDKDVIIGIALEAGVENDVIEILLVHYKASI